MERLTNKEEEIMQALWELQKGFVKDILALLPNESHYNTISTMVRNLEEKGYVAHQAFGKTHQYFPIVSKEEYAKGFMNFATKRFFDNSYKSMVSFFAKEEKISAEELREILDIIEKKQ
ncbi:MAG TPA: BlaI/MecI/CopY family transcriptional regulator [Flavobacteriaceae bacterium]|nr:BlaI/MecI/CopY family transcriptional regulator [Flavobacteriaceae bacterium]MCB9213636.1 BlaI/MecI/CopY family transcriptional regulator [Alteromonas sp.]HPF12137.1 BlaI/MecI/CopY family transcriptional regulator [Flavobacteriaceae bacterium]HQU22490.1 BlaI/MecI/CopY family transcriptional regulator [Flavobacteriaceae bacterium]HQU65966.1 BlaI/MecI/CopY family transcriptional regulator [Flavobacteriaceae bacterium]